MLLTKMIVLTEILMKGHRSRESSSRKLVARACGGILNPLMGVELAPGAVAGKEWAPGRRVRLFHLAI
jgi:hypothetical protein